MRSAWIAVLMVLTGVPLLAQRAEPIRRGWNAFNSVPYNSCSWLVVTGPEGAKQKLIEQAKRTYLEPDPGRLASVQDRVFVEIQTVTERKQGCSNRTFTEVIFVDKDTDKPALRLPVESREIALSNGFGADWNANDGLAVADFAEFTATLKGKYHVVVVYADGGTARIGQGAAQTVWSGSETSKVR